MPAYDIADVDELPAEGRDGNVKKLRKALGARAFGFNYFDVAPGAAGNEHDEAETGQEEVVFVLRGSGTLKVDGDEIELKANRFVRLDPDATRCPTAGDDGLVFVTFGAPVDGKYEPPSWG